MATVYRIARWKDIFEKSDAGRMKTITWVSLPIDFGDGYHSMVDDFQEDAAAMYGAWCALVAVAAKAPERGTLANSKGRPYRLSRIARETGLPAALFERLIEWASSETVAWLDVLDSSEILGDSPMASEKTRSTEPNRTEPDVTEPNVPAGRLADGERPEDGGGEGGSVQPEPLVVSARMHAELLELAQAVAESTGKRPSKRDAQEALKVAALAQHRDKGPWLDRCLDDVRRRMRRRDPPENPWGYLVKTLGNEAQRDGWDFREALRVVAFEQSKTPEPARPP